MKKLCLRIALRLFISFPLVICGVSFGSATESNAALPMTLSVSIDDREIYECWMKEQQIALGAHKALGVFDTLCEVRNAIAESCLDAKTKDALVAALDKKIAMLEKKAIERKNFLVSFRKQQRDEAILISVIMLPAIVAVGLMAALISRS